MKGIFPALPNASSVRSILGFSPPEQAAEQEPYLRGLLPLLEASFPTSRIVNIVCLGDSITAGYLFQEVRPTEAYPALLARWLDDAFPASTCNVIHAGVGGDNTIGALRRLQHDVVDHHPDLVTVCLGMNDFLGQEVDEYAGNLRSIVERLREAGIEHVILMTTMPFKDPPKDQKPYMEAVEKLAAELGVGFADVYGPYEKLDKSDPAKIWSNGINHPTPDGHRIYVGALIDLFRQAMGRTRPE